MSFTQLMWVAETEKNIILPIMLPPQAYEMKYAQKRHTNWKITT